nr:FAD-dependent oxidoreductase [Micromonospora sp. DSM 115978]
RVQPLTATFRMGNVVDPAPTAELHRLMRAAAESGEYRLPRLEGSAHRTVLPGVFHTNLTRVVGVDATEPWELTAAEVAGRRQVAEYVRFLREQVPGYADAYLLSSSTRIGVRESRRLVGRYVLTRDDVLSAREFDDAVARCGAPVEDHDSGDATRWEYVGTSARQPTADGGELAASAPTGLTYGVPYRTLLPLELEGLLVAGRCLSATHDAHASVRSIAQCTATGQAAGTAAALAVRGGVTPAELDPAVLRAELRAQGAVL